MSEDNEVAGDHGYDQMLVRTGTELNEMAVVKLDINIVDMTAVPENVQEVLDSEMIHVFIIEGTTATGVKFELMFRDQQVASIGHACSVYITDQLRHMVKDGGIGAEAIIDLIKRITENPDA